MKLRICTLAAASAAAGALDSLTESRLQQYSQCQWNSLGTSFDLSPTHHTSAQGPYKVPDIRDMTTSYYFNPCDQVTVPDAVACSTSSRVNNTNPSTGWQIEEKSGEKTCYRLGGDLAGGWNFSFFGEKRSVRRHRVVAKRRSCPIHSRPFVDETRAEVRLLMQ